MYLDASFEGAEAIKKAMERAPFGPGFPEETAKKAVKMEVHTSSFTDPGPDFTLFKLYDKDGTVFAERKISGY